MSATATETKPIRIGDGAKEVANLYGMIHPKGFKTLRSYLRITPQPEV